MCIAICQPEGATTLSLSLFKECAKTNDDGLGMGWIDWTKPEDKRLRIWRSVKRGSGFDVEHFHEKYRILHQQHGKRSPFILHFRYTTHGDTNQYNCHPFRVKPLLAMAHNGILAMPVKGHGIRNLFHSRDIRPEYSDTWHYANLYFPKFDYLDFHKGDHWYRDGKNLKGHTEDFIGTGNKLVFLDANQYDEEARNKWGAANYVIYNEKQGVWDGGTWFSNTGYKSYVSGSCGTTWRGNSYARSGYWNDEDEMPREWHECATEGCKFWCKLPEIYCTQHRHSVKAIGTTEPKTDPQHSEAHTDTKYYGSGVSTVLYTYCRFEGCKRKTEHPKMHYCSECLPIVVARNKEKKEELQKQIAEDTKCSESSK